MFISIVAVVCFCFMTVPRASAGTYTITSCGDCHLYPPLDAPSTRGIPTGAVVGNHQKHASTVSGNYGFSCSVCHIAPATTTSADYAHRNGKIDMQASFLSVSGSYSTGTSFPQVNNPVTGTCSAVYCHTQGRSNTPPFTGASPNVIPTWGSSFGVTCTGCHGGGSQSSTQMSSGSHQKHLLDCSLCHNATAAAVTTIGSTANHVNAKVDIRFSGTIAETSAQWRGSPAETSTVSTTPGTSYATSNCTNIKCHSDGTNIWNGQAVSSTTPTWGATKGCSYTTGCHGNSTFPSDYRQMAPLYNSTTSVVANAKPNAHDPHITNGTVNAGETQCKHCHYSTTTDNVSTVPGTHGNGAYTLGSFGTVTYASGEDVSTSVAVNLTYTFSAATGVSTCSNVSCHPNGLGGTKPANPWNDKDSANFACTDCHNINLTSNATYHHSMNTLSYTPNPASETDYPATAPSGTWNTGTNPTSRKCLMCHVKHMIFSDRSNTNANLTAPRAMNLRTDIGAAPTSAANYTNTDYLSTGAYGICISCHSSQRIKDTVEQKAEAGSTMTYTISGSDFSAGIHQYAVPLTMKTGGAKFYANCSKCHDSQNGETAAFMTTTNIGVHDNTVRRLYAPMGTTLTDGHDEDVCFRCHSKAADAVGGTKKTADANDWYGVITTMSGPSTSIYSVISSKTYSHNVSAYTGQHHPADEGRAANNGTMSGTNRHVECVDCHDPHAAQPIASGNLRGTLVAGSTTTLTANPSPVWTTNQLSGWTVAIVEGTGAGQMSVITRNTTTLLTVRLGTAPNNTSKYVIFQDGTTSGNQITNAQLGVWGVAPTAWTSNATATVNWNDSAGAPADPYDTNGIAQFNTMSSWTRTESATVQGMICIKCHSYYAYGASLPLTPSGLPGGGGTMSQPDKANEFNPTNLGYHPVMARGKNQPIRASYGNTALSSVHSPNWPIYSSNTNTLVVSAGSATFSGTASLPPSAIPGWFVYVGSSTAPAGANAGTATTGYLEIVSIATPTQFTVRSESGNNSWPLNTVWNTTPNVAATRNWFVTAGLGNAFVPPWGPWSTMRCSDCHQSNTSTDPMGPHGSATKYLLTAAGAQNFDFWNGTAMATISYTPNTATFCLNCHRQDVYGDTGVTAPATNYSRQKHPPDSSNKSSLTTANKWGVVCMNCHGGARAGGIHGENLGYGNGGASVGSYSGKRLLGGSTWYGVTRSTTGVAGSCWTKGSTDVVDNCGHTHSGTTFQSGVANYDYDTNP